MISNRIFLITIVISLALHVALLAVAGFIDIGTSRTHSDPLIVSLEDPPAGPDPVGTEEEVSTPSQDLSMNTSDNVGPIREDTVELDTMHSKYDIYLAYLRGKIEREWRYPRQAQHAQKEGIAIILFTITDRGRLSETLVVGSSGCPVLDDESIRTIQSAAPFEPLPVTFNLSRLNIVAAFDYRITN